MSYIYRHPIGSIFTYNSDMQNTHAMDMWAKKHCPSYITVDTAKTDIWYYCFYFSEEKDHVLFLLRWL